MVTYVMRMRGTGNEIGHCEAVNATAAAEKIWERHQDARARANPALDEILNRDVPWALVTVGVVR